MYALLLNIFDMSPILNIFKFTCNQIGQVGAHGYSKLAPNTNHIRPAKINSRGQH